MVALAGAARGRSGPEPEAPVLPRRVSTDTPSGSGRGRARRRRAGLALGVLVFVGLGLAAWSALRPTGHVAWRPWRSGAVLSPQTTDVLLIALCTLRRDRLGLYGYERPTSPFMDRLGDEGVVFEQALAQAPWTRPSMGAIMTGRWPRVLKLDNPNTTGSFRMVIHEEHVLLSEALGARGYAAIGAVANPNLKGKFGFAQGFEAYFEPSGTYSTGTSTPRAARVVDELLALEEAVPDDQRLYARVVMLDTHRRPRFRQEFLADFAGQRRRLQNYDAAIRTTDAEVERLVTELRRRRPDLLVIVAADHGEGLKDPPHHGNEHGRYLYQTAIRTPLLFHHPELEGGRRVEGLAMNIDIHPTVLGLLGLEPRYEVDGADLSAVVAGAREETGRDVVFSETFMRQEHKATAWDGAHHLVRRWEDGAMDGPHSDRLYAASDWRADHDLAEELPEVRVRLAASLDAWHLRQGELAAAAPGASKEELDAETRSMLRELGYVDELATPGSPPPPPGATRPR